MPPAAPVPGDIYAAYSPLADCYCVYQFIRYKEGKANTLAYTHILPMRGFYAHVDDIALDKLEPTDPQQIYLGGSMQPTTVAAIESMYGYIPVEHIRLGHLPLFADTDPVVYGRSMHTPVFIPETMRVPPYNAPTDESLWQNGEQFDMAAFVEHQSHMHVLGARDVVMQHFRALEQLTALRSLTLFDVRIEADDIPDLTQLPHLNFVWIWGIPAEAGKALKKQMQTLAKSRPQRLTYSIARLRSPAWYAANQDNPLMRLGDDDTIAKKDVKQAIKIYKDSQKQALQLSAATLQTDLETLAAQYAGAFNRFTWIETTQRETICSAFWQIATLAAQQHHSDIDLDAIQAAMDRVRDW